MSLTLPLTEAAAFTAGCALIHALRRHADAVTVTLACLAAFLVLLLGLALAPEPVATAQADIRIEEMRTILTMD